MNKIDKNELFNKLSKAKPEDIKKIGLNKSTDIDKMSKYKFDAIKKIIENKSISNEYNCFNIFKVSYVDDDDVKFVDISNNENIDFKDVLKQIKYYKMLNLS